VGLVEKAQPEPFTFAELQAAKPQVSSFPLRQSFPLAVVQVEIRQMTQSVEYPCDLAFQAALEEEHQAKASIAPLAQEPSGKVLMDPLELATRVVVVVEPEVLLLAGLEVEHSLRQ
jgi:hypothetical protein